MVTLRRFSMKNPAAGFGWFDLPRILIVGWSGLSARRCERVEDPGITGAVSSDPARIRPFPAMD
jgi:hypothetical protein